MTKKFLVKKDSRLSNLFLTISYEGQIVNLTHPVDSHYRVHLSNPIDWDEVDPAYLEELLRITIINSAESGGGSVFYSLGSLTLKSEHRAALRPSEGCGLEQMITWKKDEVEQVPSVSQAKGGQVLSGEIGDGKAPVEMVLGLQPCFLKGMDRNQVDIHIFIPISYEIKPDNGERFNGAFNLEVKFTLRKDLGPAYLAIDFGTSAIAVAFEGDEDNLLPDGGNNPPCLLNLESFLIKELGLTNANQREIREMNPEKGTGFIPSICCLYPAESSRLGTADFIHLPMHWGAVGDNWSLTIPYLKLLIGAGYSEFHTEITYMDENGKKKRGKPPLREIVLSAYKALCEKYIEPYLREVNKEKLWNKLIVTYPNTYTLYQINFMEDVLRTAFCDKELLLISESDAVANYYLFREYDLRREENNDVPPKEHILIFDIGAGTLDLTYLYVEREEEGGHPSQITYKAKMGVPVAGRHLDTLIARLIDRKLKATETDAREKGNIAFQYAKRIVGVQQQGLDSGEAFNFWLSILQFKKDYVKMHHTSDRMSGKIPFNLGPVNVSIVRCIETDTQEAVDFYKEHGLIQERDKKGRDCFFLNIEVKEIEEDPGIKQWISFLTEEIIENILIPSSSNGGKVPLDAVVITGRTALWPGLKDRLVSKLKSMVEKPDKLFVPEIKEQEGKQAVVLGALAYAIIWKNKIQFKDRNIWGRYGLVYNAHPGQKTFRDIFPKDFSQVKTHEQDNRLIYLPEGEVTIDISNTMTIDVVCTFAADPDKALNSRQKKTLYHEALFVPVRGSKISKSKFGAGVRKVTCRSSVDKNNILKLIFEAGNKKFEYRKLLSFGKISVGWPIDPRVLPPEEREIDSYSQDLDFG